MTTYQDEIEVGGYEQEEYEILPAGTYPLVVERVESFPGRDFKTGEPRPAAKLVFEVIEPWGGVDGGDWVGVKVDKLVTLPKNMANDKSTAHQFWKGITGETPVAGGNYKFKSGLTGRRCIGVVEQYPDSQGRTWARVKSVSQPAAPRRRPQPPQQATPPSLEDEDDLDGA